MLFMRVLKASVHTGMLVYVGLPILFILLMSVSMDWRWPEVFPHAVSARAWRYVFSPYAEIWHVIGISMGLAIGVSVINVVLALPAAEALARRRVIGRIWFEALFMAPIVVSPLIAVMGFHITFIRMGIADTSWGVILAHLVPTFPYMLRSLMISYQSLGFQWEEQAAVLGANAQQRFWQVVFPFILPGLVVGFGLSMLISLSQYVITFLIGGGQVMTIALVMFPFINGGDPAIASTYALIFMAIALSMLYGSSAWLKLYYRRGFSLQERRM